MEETVKAVDEKNVSMTLKKNVKGEVYGEFTVKAATVDELSELLAQMSDLYRMYTS